MKENNSFDEMVRNLYLIFCEAKQNVLKIRNSQTHRKNLLFDKENLEGKQMSYEKKIKNSEAKIMVYNKRRADSLKTKLWTSACIGGIIFSILAAGGSALYLVSMALVELFETNASGQLSTSWQYAKNELLTILQSSSWLAIGTSALEFSFSTFLANSKIKLECAKIRAYQQKFCNLQVSITDLENKIADLDAEIQNKMMILSNLAERLTKIDLTYSELSAIDFSQVDFEQLHTEDDALKLVLSQEV